MVLQVRIERVSRGVKLYEVANALGLDVQMWAKMERGEKDTPANIADRASQLFGRPAHELFSPVEAKPLVLTGKE